MPPGEIDHANLEVSSSFSGARILRGEIALTEILLSMKSDLSIKQVVSYTRILLKFPLCINDSPIMQM